MDAFRVVWFQTSCVPARHRLVTRVEWAVHDEVGDDGERANKNMFFILRHYRRTSPGNGVLDGGDIGWDET